MKLFGVINASPDSRHKGSIVKTADEALKRAYFLLSSGANYIDLGGQGSTDDATVVTPEVEWDRLKDIVPALATLNVDLSIDTWKPEVARKALDAGATIINAADGLQNEAMLKLAAERGCPVVLPFLSGPDPRHMKKVEGDPIKVLLEWFEASIRRAAKFGIRDQLIIDPGTGFAPPKTDPENHYLYQKYLYQNLHQLRRFDLPIYIALPWRDTEKETKLLELVLSQNIDYGRSHHPDIIRKAERRFMDR